MLILVAKDNDLDAFVINISVNIKTKYFGTYNSINLTYLF